MNSSADTERRLLPHPHWWPLPRAAAQVAYYGLCCFILALGAVLRFHLPICPLADYDIGGYLTPALSKLTGGAFQHTQGRNFLYPGFLFVILGSCKSFAAITIVQHALGLLTGALLLASWHQIGKFIPLGPVLRPVHLVLGILLLAVYVLSNQPIVAEHELRPEAIIPLFAVLSVFLNLKLLQRSYLWARRWPSAVAAAAVIFVAVLMASLKPSFDMTALASMLPVTRLLSPRKPNWIIRLIVISGALLSGVLLILPEQYLAKSDPVAKSFLAETLFYMHANLIADQMGEDIGRGRCGERGCEWLRRIQSELREEMSRSWQLNQNYHSLGFNPDYLMYTSRQISQWRDKFFDGRDSLRLHFYSYYARRILLTKPASVLAKVWGQMRLFYRTTNPAFFHGREINLAERYQLSFQALQNPALHRRILAFAPARKFENASASLARDPRSVSQPWALRFCNRVLSRSYLPVFAAVLSLSSLLLFRQKLRLTVGMLWPATLMVYSYNFATCLETAAIHSLHQPRYVTVQFSFTLLAALLGIWFLIFVALQTNRLRRY